MGSDDALFAWMRYYGSCILLLAALGIVAGLAAVSLSPNQVAASTLVIETGESIAPRQLGPVAIAVFRSESVVASASRELREPDPSVVEDGSELIPLPDAPALFVLGRASDFERAAELSEAAAGALVEALNGQVEAEEFRIFSGPQPWFLPGDRTESVSVAIGAASGFWLGLSYAVLHYRWKRPVLTLHRALVLSGADQLAIHHGRGWPWLGLMRDRFQKRAVARNEIRLAWLRTSSDEQTPVPTGALEVGAQVGGGPPATSPNGADVLVITARPGTEEKAIATSRLMVGGADIDRAGRIGLVWVR